MTSLGYSSTSAVFKTHSPDQDLLNLAIITRAKIIVTSRDPRDVLVSQQERFGEDFRSATCNLARSLVAIASLPPIAETLHLRYEDGFTANLQTVRLIADFIDVPATADECAMIFEFMSSSAVASRILNWMTANPARDPKEWDSATHWHPTHIGDGVIGKWHERLPQAQADSAEGALLPFDVGRDWRKSEIFWRADLFHGSIAEDGIISVEVDGTARTAVYGPYLTLPVGRWRIDPLIKASAMEPITVKLDAITISGTHETLELKTVTLPGSSMERIALEIDVVDHTHAMEVRLSTIEGGPHGNLLFSGVRLRYIGESLACRTPSIVQASLPSTPTSSPTSA